MIRFACHCKHRFEVPTELAGGAVQCPRCGKLNDVPTLSDLPNLEEDGTYRVDVERRTDNPYRLRELEIIYAKGPRDDEGDEIDLRMTAAELQPDPPRGDPQDDDGGGELLLEGEIPATAAETKPRYDPVTGELIRPLDIKKNAAGPADPEHIPMAKA